MPVLASWTSWVKTAVDISTLLLPLIVADSKAKASGRAPNGVADNGLEWRYQDGELTAINQSGNQIGVYCFDAGPGSSPFTDYTEIDAGNQHNFTSILRDHPDSTMTYASTDPPLLPPFLAAGGPGTARCFVAASLGMGTFFALTGGLVAGWGRSADGGVSVFLRAASAPSQFTITANATGTGGTSASVTATVNRTTAGSPNEWEFPLGNGIQVENWMPQLDIDLLMSQDDFAKLVGKRKQAVSR